jgi:carbohydrate-selective porin OprB
MSQTSDFGTFGRYTEIPLGEMTSEQKKGYDLVVQERGLRRGAGAIHDWSPPSINRNNTMLTAGVRFNEPLPLRIHNTMSLGYIQNRLSQQFLPSGTPPWKTEHGVEFNMLLDPLPMLLLQPVVQYYENVGARTGRAVVFGFRTKVEF